jgi:F-type H+-transporting ATPase subunit c
MNLDPNIVKLIISGLTIALGTIMPAFAIGKIGSEALKAISRNPEATSKIQTAMLLAIAFAESIAIYVLVMAIIIKFI